MKPFFSIIVGFRNRELNRVNNALESLARQSYKSFELIFIDYGSDEDVAGKTRQLVSTYSFSQYHYCNSKGWFWNRSHALNTGIEKASGHVLLIYDIDLVIEDDFLQKIASLNYDREFYTFSCFYLPRHFDVPNKNLLTDGIHYEQNYVGLCAVKRELVESIHGFDEYFMVWGGEDDDFYQRLSCHGLSRKQMQASQYMVFHQWHLTESPVKPTLWYLTMVNYLFSKNRNNSNVSNRGRKFSLKEDRPVLKLIQDNSYKNYTKLEFLNDQKLLFFNSFIQKFQQLEPATAAYLEYEAPEDKKTSKNFLKLLGKAPQKKEQIDLKDISNFLEYFIGINREYLSDYFIKKNGDRLLFVCIKK